MAELQGSAAKAAYKHAVTWGTAVTLGDGDQVEYASETVLPDVQLVESDQITGEALSGASETGQVIVQGDVAGQDLKYEGHERWITDVFGSEATTGGAGVFQHKHDFELSNEGYFGTLAFEKVVTGPHEVDSFKPMGLTVTGAAGQPVKITVRGIGRQLRTKDPGRTNDASTTWSLPGLGAAPSVRRLVKFGQVTIQIGPWVGSTPPAYPGDYDPLCVSGFTLDFQRNGEPVQTTCDGDYASEPSTDTVEITGTFDFPIYDDANDFLVDANIAKTSLSAVITFDSGVDLGAGPANYRHVIWIPAFQLTGGYPNVGGKGRVPLSAAFRVHLAAAAVDTDATMPRWYVHNGIADTDDYGNV